LGERASADCDSGGAEKAVVAAVWELEAGAAKKVAEVLSENGIDGDGGDGEGGEESGSLILRREVAAGGKGRIFVNISRRLWRCEAAGAASGYDSCAERDLAGV